MEAAQRILRLRNALVGLTDETVESVFSFILSDSGFENFSSFVGNLADCLRARPFQVHAFIQLIKYVCDSFPDAVSLIKAELLNEFLPHSKWAVSFHDFTFLLPFIEAELFSEEEIVDRIKQLWKSRDYNSFDYTVMLYLMPILEQHIPAQLEHITDFFMRMAAYDDVSSACDDFCDEEYMEVFKANNYQLQQQLVSDGHNGDPVIPVLFADDVASLQELSSSADFNIQNSLSSKWYCRHEGNTYAEIAAYFGSIQCLKFLLSLGAPYNKPTMARCMAASGNMEIFEMFVDQDLPLDSALNAAISYENLDIVENLLDRGVESSSAMHVACHRGCLGAFLKLLERGKRDGIDICPCFRTSRNIIDFIFNSEDPKELLAVNGEVPVDVLTKLACTGDVSYLRPFEGEISSESLGSMILAASKAGQIEMFQYLVEQGAPLDQSTINGETILHCAVESGSLVFLNFILSIPSVDVNAVECNHRTPLHLAVSGSSKILQRLIDQDGVDFTIGDDSGETAIMMSTQSAKKFKMLLDTKKCDPMHTNWEGNTLAHICVFSCNEEILGALIAYDGVDWRAENSDGKTPYDCAVRYEYPEMAHMLEEAGLNFCGSGKEEEEEEYLHTL